MGGLQFRGSRPPGQHADGSSAGRFTREDIEGVIPYHNGFSGRDLETMQGLQEMSRIGFRPGYGFAGQKEVTILIDIRENPTDRSFRIAGQNSDLVVLLKQAG